MKKALLSNAVFSLISGLFLVFKNQFIANLFQTNSPLIYTAIGMGLILFSAYIFFESKRQNPISILVISTLDFFWVLGSVYLITLRPFDISATGMSLIVIVAIIVLFFAVWQSINLDKIDNSHSENGIKQFLFSRKINAPKHKIWRTVSDISNYNKVAPNLDKTEILSGEGEGMVRSCSHGNKEWKETCTGWKEGEYYTFNVQTDAPDYPFPVSYLTAHWQVNEINKDQSEIIMKFNFKYKYKIYNLIIHPFMKSWFEKVCEELLDNWEKEIIKD